MTEKQITLSQAIVRGKNEIQTLTLIKPNVLALKGLNLLNLMQIDVDSALKLLPRITKPTLTKADLERMDVKDFTTLCVEMTALIGGVEEESDTESDTETEGKSDKSPDA